MDQAIVFNGHLEKLEEKLNILPDKKEETPHNTLFALWFAAAGRHISPIMAEKKDLPHLTSLQLELLESLITHRLADVPLAHLTGRQHFMGMEFIVNKGLYIPRKETELLAKTAITQILNDFSDLPTVKVLDICTGIGTVALAIASHCKNVQVYGSDIYTPAIDCAHTNATHFCLEDRSFFFNADLFDPFESLSLKNNVHVVVSAPPYISSPKVKLMAEEISNHEPKEAFDAGPWGLSIFFKLISTSQDYLLSGGYLVFECGQGQSEYLAKRIQLTGQYHHISEVKDENGHGRVLLAQKI